MSSIDERLVRMMFDNADFERGVRTTLTSLAQLQKGLQLPGATRGLDEASAAAKRFSLGNISAGIDQIASKFSGLSVIATAALATIASKATIVGTQVAKALSIQPVLDGFKDYELKVGATQTIMSGTGESIGTVTKYLKELDIYADQTIYSLADMTSNIGKFTNAGVKLPVAVEAMKGIANVAALSGASSEEAARAMYNLGQAIGQGSVKLMDWKSVELANMGTLEFKQQLIDQAVAFGTLTKASDGSLKSLEGTTVTAKNFSTTLADQWLTAEVLTKTLGNYADKNTDIGKKAWKAATEVKSLSMMTETLKAAAGTGWTDTFEIALGTLPEATKTLTSLTNVIGGFIGASADARNKVLGDWKALGGRTVLIEGISSAFHALMAVIKPIKDAFREIFPAKTGQDLYSMTVAFRDFAAGLTISAGTADKLRSTFAGVFAVLNIGKTIIMEAIGLLLRLFGVAGKGTGSFLDVTASIGDFLVGVNNALTKGGLLHAFFTRLGDVLEIPIRLIKQFASALGSAFSNIDFGNVGNGLSGIIAPLGKMSGVGDLVSSAWNKVTTSLGKAWNKFLDFISSIGNSSGGLGDALASVFEGVNFERVLATIKTGLLAVIVLAIRNFIKGLRSSAGGPGIFDNIRASFDQLTGTLKTMQQALSAATLLAIAIAIGILTLSVVALSKIDAAGLTKALIAISVMATQLVAAMLVLQKFGAGGATQLILIGAAMVLLAVAVNILASAVKKLADLSWEELRKGLYGVTILILGLSAATKLMAGNSAGMITTAAGLILLAVAIKILASAVADLSGLSWEELAKGLIGVGTLLGALALFTKFSAVGKGGIVQGAGLILLAVGIKILASAVKDFAESSWQDLAKGLVAISAILAAFAIFSRTVGNPAQLIASGAALILIGAAMHVLAGALAKFADMTWEEIAKGLLTMGGAMLIIAAAMYAMTGALPGAAATLVVSASLGMLAAALNKMAGMTWEEIAKGLIVLAGSLTIIAAAMMFMTGALPGAAALVVISAALRMLAPALMILGSMSWESIAKGLIALTGAFLVIGAAGILLGPLVPVLIGLGIAITLLGIGAALAGVGVLAFSVGLTALAVAGVAGVTAIVGIVKGLVGLIPYVMEQIGKGIIAFAQVIATAGPAITKAITTVLNSFLDAIVKITPKVVSTLLNMINMMLAKLANAIPQMVASGTKIIVGLLEGLQAAIPKIMPVAINCVVAFINGVAQGLPRVIDAGVKLVIAFVNGVANAINSNSAAMGAAGANLGMAIVSGIVKGIAGGIGAVTSAAGNLARSALATAKGALGIGSPSKEFERVGKFAVSGFVKGLRGTRDEVKATFKDMVGLLKEAMTSSSEDVKNAEAKLKKLTSAREKDTKAIKAAEKALAQAKLEHKETSATYALMTNRLVDQKNKLAALAGQYERVTDKLNDANAALNDAIKTRDDYTKSIQESFSGLPDLAGNVNLQDYEDMLMKQIQNTQEFARSIQKLRELGLNDDLYKELLTKGTAALPFITQLLKGGKVEVDKLNGLSSSLEAAAFGLGATASTQLYQAGVMAALGLVKGLREQQENIAAEMDRIAESMVNAVTKKLGIQSPSMIFATIGKFAMLGLATGIKNYGSLVETSAGEVGKDAILAMSKSISGMSDIISGDLDINPTITPVLDLSGVKKDASLLNTMLSGVPLSVDAAYSTARDAAAGYNANQQSSTNDAAQAVARQEGLIFNQYNTSPKALSSAEIYRQTKNQLSVAKGALTT